MAAIVNRIAVSVDRPFRLPNCPSGSNPSFSASFVIFHAAKASMIFPWQLNKEIGRQAFASSFCYRVLPGLGRIIILAFLYIVGKWPILKEASVIFTIAMLKGLPRVI